MIAHPHGKAPHLVVDPLHSLRTRCGSDSPYLTCSSYGNSIETWQPERGVLRARHTRGTVEIFLSVIPGRAVAISESRFVTITYHNSYDGSLIDVTSKLLGLPKPYSSTILDFGRTELRPSPHVPIVRIGAEDGEIAEEMFPIDSVGELLAEEGLLTLHDGSTRHYHDLSEYRHLHEHFGRRSLFLHRSGQILAGRGWSCSEGYRFERSAQGATYALRFEQDRHGQACVDRYLLHIDPNNLRFSTYRLNLRRPL